MKKHTFLLACAAIVFVAIISACSKDGDSMPDDARSYSFTVTRNNTALSNASLKIQTNSQSYSAQTDNTGKCQIKVPNDVSLPDYAIVTVEHNNARPVGFSVPGSRNSQSSRSISCKSLPSVVLVNDASLYHLGNDQYSGDANSQLQKATDGIYKTFSFYLSSIPSQMPHFQIYARGVQHPTEIKINGTITRQLNDSSSNGDIDKYEGQLIGNPSTVLQPGYNTLTIKTGANNPSDPWDDIEFCALLLYYP